MFTIRTLRDQENEYLLKQITRIHADSRETYGSPRVHAELTLGLGLQVNLKRVARLMREAGIQGLSTGADAVAAPSATPLRSPAATWSSASSPSREPIGYGSSISPSIPPWKARCTARP